MQIFGAVWNVQNHPLLARQSCSCLPASLCLAFPYQSQQLCLRMVQSSQNTRKSPESLARDPHQLAVSPACQRWHCLHPWSGATSGNRGQPCRSTSQGKKQREKAQLKAQTTDPLHAGTPTSLKEEETTIKSCVTAELQEAIVTLRGRILSHCILWDTNHVFIFRLPPTQRHCEDPAVSPAPWFEKAAFHRLPVWASFLFLWQHDPSQSRVHWESLRQQTRTSDTLWILHAINLYRDGWHQPALVLAENNIQKKAAQPCRSSVPHLTTTCLFVAFYHLL